jgi:hypothetical protein
MRTIKTYSKRAPFYNAFVITYPAVNFRFDRDPDTIRQRSSSDEIYALLIAGSEGVLRPRRWAIRLTDTPSGNRVCAILLRLRSATLLR